MVADLLEVDAESVLDTELFLYNRMNGSIWGADDEFFSSAKIDDLQHKIDSLRAEQAELAAQSIPTEQYKNLQKEIFLVDIQRLVVADTEKLDSKI